MEIQNYTDVSIHAPARGATRSKGGLVGIYTEFQSTPPHEGRLPEPVSAICLFYVFQSTPPHEGRLHIGGCAPPQPFVSIHAPARGATCSLLRFFPTQQVSIHAPARGATTSGSMCFTVKLCFNPRPRTRGDEMAFDLLEHHQPFQSTPPHEGRR